MAAPGGPVYIPPPGAPGSTLPSIPNPLAGILSAEKDFTTQITVMLEVALGVALVGAALLLIVSQTKTGGELVGTGKQIGLMVATRGLVK